MKIKSIITATAIMASLVLPATANESEIMLISENTGISVSVNAQSTEVNAIKDGEMVMIPLRSVCEALEMNVSWDGESRMITVEKMPVYITFSPDSDGYTFARTAPMLLGAKPVLTDGITYVPLNFATDILHADVVYENNEIYINTFEEVKNHATITAISENEITVEDSSQGEVIVNITENTEFYDEIGVEISIADFSIEDSIEIVYDNFMTMSIPPMTNAVKVFKAGNGETESADISVNKGIIKEIGEDFISIEDLKLGNVIVNITEETLITDENGEALEITSLLANDSVDVVYESFMTMSLPPKTNALHITKVSAGYETVTTTIISVESDENNNFSITTGADDIYSQTVYKIAPDTEIYSFDGELITADMLKQGTEIKIGASALSTRSIPPQKNAFVIMVLSEN